MEQNYVIVTLCTRRHTGYDSQSSDTVTTLIKRYLLNRRASPPLEITNRQAMTIFYWAREMSPNRPNTAVTGRGYNSQSSNTDTTLTKRYLLNRRASPPLENYK